MPRNLSAAKQAIVDAIVAKGCKPCANLVRGCNEELPLTYFKTRCEPCLIRERQQDKARRDQAKIEHAQSAQLEIVKCSACKKEKPRAEFVGDRQLLVERCQSCRDQDKRNNLNRDKERRREQGRRSDLKRADKKKAYHAAHPEVMQRAWRSFRARQVIANVDQALSLGAAQQSLTRQIHPEYAAELAIKRKTDPHYAFATYKMSAKDKNIDMAMDEESMRHLFFSPCFYCNEPKGEFLQGIDRMDSFQGYIPGNCVTCCSTCNRMKGCLDAATFIRRAMHIEGGEKAYPECFPDSFCCRFSRYKYRASQMGLVFELKEEMFNAMIFMPCYLCGKHASSSHRNGIDRVDNALGYLESNIEPCCGECNAMKKDISLSLFCNKLKMTQTNWRDRELPNVPTCLLVISKSSTKKKAGERQADRENRKRQKVEKAKAYLQSIGRLPDLDQNDSEEEPDQNQNDSEEDQKQNDSEEEQDQNDSEEMEKHLADPSSMFHQFCVQEGLVVA
jgi:hypothetical protein